MKHDIIGCVIALAVGVGIAYLNYTVSKILLNKKRDSYYLTQYIRTAINLAFLILLYFVAEPLGYDRTWFLVGGCVGLTVPLIFFTSLLIKENERIQEKNKNKNDDNDGR